MAMLGINITGPEWEQLTGIKVRVSEVPYEELFPKAMLEHRAGTGAYDMLHDRAVLGRRHGPRRRARAARSLHREVRRQERVRRHRAGVSDWMTFDGKTYALVVDGDVHILYYRKDLFEDPANMEAFKAKYGYDLGSADRLGRSSAKSASSSPTSTRRRLTAPA